MADSADISSTDHQVNLLDLAAASLASTVAAARPIRELSSSPSSHYDDSSNSSNNDNKNARLKDDGSVVTDADFMAQGLIVQMLRETCPSQELTIVGEESEDEMRQHTSLQTMDPQENSQLIHWAHAEIYGRFQASDESHVDVVVNCSRVRVFVDPLDGTKSYAKGDYDSVTVLIAIILDNRPCFGVICKPFGYGDNPTILRTGCVAIHGGQLLDGVYIAGGSSVTKPTRADTELPRAIISESRSEGLVQDFVQHLAASQRHVLHPDFILCSGAGAKSLRLVLPARNEALWFFPKAGTSRWDIAASDALLRQLGGKVTDKYGNELDYCRSREDSENSQGIIASNDAVLHGECLKLLHEGKWIERYAETSSK